ncbi:MAG TPA: DUF5996 family protein [Bryobacteraceae bacterium]|nr:DUF5996 family protein [Bryobacteraceae bacterium]
MPTPEFVWPELPLAAWSDTYATLHMWMQIAGKIRTTLSPPVNHWWHSALYVNSRGLTTSPVPFRDGAFELQFDFIDHRLEISGSDGGRQSLSLSAEPVAVFHQKLMSALRSMGVEITINEKPQEVANPIPFSKDYQHASYDPEYAHRWWRILLSTEVVLSGFRSRFIGKCSPVHFFWGSFDLCCTRFSGRPAPPRKGVITSEAYSHECSSAGFWPGGGPVSEPAFYAYTAPAPEGLADAPLRPAAAFWHKDFSEFILKYEDVRLAASPPDTLLEFLQSTYEAGANLARWERAALERR